MASWILSLWDSKWGPPQRNWHSHITHSHLLKLKFASPVVCVPPSGKFSEIGGPVTMRQDRYVLEFMFPVSSSAWGKVGLGLVTSLQKKWQPFIKRVLPDWSISLLSPLCPVCSFKLIQYNGCSWSLWNHYSDTCYHWSAMDLTECYISKLHLSPSTNRLRGHNAMAISTNQSIYIFEGVRALNSTHRQVDKFFWLKLSLLFQWLTLVQILPIPNR
jgi:hypothetical protein